MPRCGGCDAHISERYARVMGDNEGTVSACPSCRAEQLAGDESAHLLDDT